MHAMCDMSTADKLHAYARRKRLVTMLVALQYCIKRADSFCNMTA